MPTAQNTDTSPMITIAGRAYCEACLALCDASRDQDEAWEDIRRLEIMAKAIVNHHRGNATLHNALNGARERHNDKGVMRLRPYDVASMVGCEIDYLDLSNEAIAVVRAIAEGLLSSPPEPPFGASVLFEFASGVTGALSPQVSA